MVPFYLHGGWNSGIWAWKYNAYGLKYLQHVSNLTMFHNIIKNETYIYIMYSAWYSMIRIMWYVQNLCFNLQPKKYGYIYSSFFLFFQLYNTYIFIMCARTLLYFESFFPEKLKIDFCFGLN